MYYCFRWQRYSKISNKYDTFLLIALRFPYTSSKVSYLGNKIRYYLKYHQHFCPQRSNK